jgi:hypothetical protein
MLQDQSMDSNLQERRRRLEQQKQEVIALRVTLQDLENEIQAHKP